MVGGWGGEEKGATKAAVEVLEVFPVQTPQHSCLP